MKKRRRKKKGWGGELGGSAKSTGVCQQSTKVAYDLVFSVMYRPKKKKKKKIKAYVNTCIEE